MISSRTSTVIIVSAVVIGLAVDQLLLRVPMWGLNVPIALGLLAVASMTMPNLDDLTPWAWLAAVFFASMWAVRDAEALLAVDLMAALSLASLPLLRERQVSLPTIALFELVVAPLRTARAITFGTFGFAYQAREQFPGQVDVGRGRAIAVGGLITVPLIMVFGSLFSSADPVFDTAVSSFFTSSVGPLFSHALTAGFLAWGTAGFLWVLSKPSRATAPEIQPPVIGGIQVLTPLVALLVLFTLFIGIQARSLFGGASFVETTTGLTFAEYARGGFFQLVFASVLVLPLLYFSPAVAGPLDERATRWLRGVMFAQIALTTLVLASALWRMSLYIRAYGLTEDRLNGTAVMVWIAATLGVFAFTVAAGDSRRAAFGSLVAAVVTLGALNLLNPHATIARYNLDHQTGREIDFEHLARLGGDAVPILVAGIDQVPAASRCQVVTKLRSKYLVTEGDWRSWNLGRQRAHDAVVTLAPVGPCGAPIRS